MEQHNAPLRMKHAGELLQQDFLDDLGISQSQLAAATHVPRSRISAICRGERPITMDTAIRLGKALGTTAQFWMNLQNEYDLREAERTHDYAMIHALVAHQANTEGRI
jgi:antitoxin HigA-1